MLSRPRGQLGELGALQHCLAIGHSHLVLLDMHQEGLLVTVPLTTLGALEVALLQMDNAEMTLHIDPGWRLVGALLALVRLGLETADVNGVAQEAGVVVISGQVAANLRLRREAPVAGVADVALFAQMNPLNVSLRVRQRL